MNQKGFSLMEIIISIAIITIGLVAIISLFTSNIKSEIRSRDKLIAVYLANESIEIVRQQRDNNWFKGINWMSGIPTGDVIVGLNDENDIRTGWEIVASNASRNKIYLSEDNDLSHSTFGSYVQLEDPVPVSWKETKFTRYLTITLGGGDNTNDVAVGCFDSTDCMEVVSHVLSNGIQLTKITSYFYEGWWF